MKGRHVTIREARESDNAPILELDRLCTMGEETTLAFDRSPNFFARSIPYEQSQLLVAETDKTIIGVGGVALKSVRVAGHRMKAAYFYDLRVTPAFRRSGVASAIGDAMRDIVKEWGAEFAYSLVLEGNRASLNLVTKRGSKPIRRCVLAILPAGKAEGTQRWRPLQEQDLDRLPPLLERSFLRHDLFPPSDVDTVTGWLKRCPGLSLRTCYGLDRGGDLAACFGLWDYSSIMRISIGRGGPVEQSRSRGLFQAEEIAPHLLLPLAFQDPPLLAEAVREARRLLAERQGGPVVPALLVPYDPEDRPFAELGRFERFELGIRLFARPLRDGVTLGDRPLYLDPIDL